MIVFYYWSPRITRSVVYGPKPRNRLDIYLPRSHLRDLHEPLPVVIFITGERSTCSPFIPPSQRPCHSPHPHLRLR